MGNKLKTGMCLWGDCEQVLIHPYNDFQMCSVHTKMMHKIQYEFRKKVRKTKNKKMGGTNIVHKDNMQNQRWPIGQPTDNIE